MIHSEAASHAETCVGAAELTFTIGEGVPTISVAALDTLGLAADAEGKEAAEEGMEAHTSVVVLHLVLEDERDFEHVHIGLQTGAHHFIVAISAIELATFE